MIGRIAALACLVGLGLGPGSAEATPYRVVSGVLVDAESGDEAPAAGAFEISLPPPDPGALPGILRIEDLQLELAGQSLGPRPPFEFEGHPELALRIADQIQFDGDTVTFAFFHAGGELLGADASQVAFRFLEFRAEGPGAGTLFGELGDSLEPRRIRLKGILSEIDQYYRLPPDDCPITPLPPGPIPPIGGDTGTGGVIIIANPAGPGLSPAEGARVSPPTPDGEGVPPPTLEELGITAPDGAVVSYDDGELTVSTPGDLIIAGGLWDLPGLTRVSLEAGGAITVEGALELPPDSVLDVESGGSATGDGSIVLGGGGSIVIGGGGPVVTGPDPIPPGDVVIAPSPIFIPFCESLLPVFPPVSRELGELSLVLSAAQPVEIDVRPHRIHPKSHGKLAVVIHGSSDLDVHDIDVESLRLGAGEAGVIGKGRSARRHRDANGDGIPDLRVRFEARDAGIAAGDTEVCLFGETRDGLAIEGCDAIATQRRVHLRTRRK